MKFLLDAMLPPSVADLLGGAGHNATTPALLGAHNLADETLIAVAAADGWVIVTENASDFAAVTNCPVLLVRKSWWPTESLATRLAEALHGWAELNPEPGPWPHWLVADMR